MGSPQWGGDQSLLYKETIFDIFHKFSVKNIRCTLSVLPMCFNFASGHCYKCWQYLIDVEHSPWRKSGRPLLVSNLWTSPIRHCNVGFYRRHLINSAVFNSISFFCKPLVAEYHLLDALWKLINEALYLGDCLLTKYWRLNIGTWVHALQCNSNKTYFWNIKHIFSLPS